MLSVILESSASKYLSLSWLIEYLIKTYEEDPYHILIEVSCFLVILWLLFRKSYDPKTTERLSRREEDQLIEEWKPDSLVPKIDERTKRQRSNLVLESATDSYVTINGNRYLNFSSNNFLGLANDKRIKENCRKTIDHYGVGSCGPRGFYGTIDVHLKLEKDIAEFYGLEHSILYSDGIACASSVVPAFCKRGDLIICDEAINFFIQQGIVLSRSTVIYFKHNDMEDLERVLQEVREQDRANPNRKLNRRFIIVEGVYRNVGDLCPLKTVVDLKFKYKYRLMVDDSFGIGVLGEKGRGTLEHFSINPADVEAIVATLDTCISSVGGFCTGDKQVVSHQRLSGAGYCFSASSPPYTATAASTALAIINQDPSRCELSRQKARHMRNALKQIEGITVPGEDFIPLIHIRLRQSLGSGDADQAFMHIVEEKMLSEGVVVYVPKYIPSEREVPEASLCISVTTLHSDQDLDRTANLLKHTFEWAFTL